ncbi:hypothetical protein [Endozoicomonas sp.]|uniref:hypothetical protein n=1 Tax=Endozoicomonas sp. TaxID=1892382 RepID=UPI003AF8534B
MLSGSYLTTGAKDLTKCPDAMTFSELDARGNELNEEPTPRTGNLIRHRSVSRALEEERSRLSEEQLPGNGTNHNFRLTFQSLDVNRNRFSEEQLPGNGTNHNFRQAFQSLDVNRNRLSEEQLPGNGTNHNFRQAFQSLDVNRNGLSEEQLPGNGSNHNFRQAFQSLDVNRNGLSEEQLPGNGTNLGNRQAFQILDVNRNMLSEEQLPGNGTPINKRSLKVVFVGMGPNALWSALQLKAKQENTNIEMFEKRTEYARNHTVNIDDSCFDSIECFNNDILREGLKTLRKKILNRRGQISCKDFETDLKAIAERMGITMHAGKGYEVVSISDGEVAFNAGKVAFDALVCADGAHSKGRKALGALSI